MLFENTNSMTQPEQYLQYWGLAKVEKPSLELNLSQSPKSKLSQSKVEKHLDDE